MDADLVIRAQRGDKDAYAVLATGIADRLLAVARRILRDHDLAEDATQQALLTLLAGPPAAPRPRSLRSVVVPAPRSRLLRGDSEGSDAGRRTSGCCP